MTTYGTPKRSIRMPDDLWAEFQAACELAGENASEVVRGLVRGWIIGQRDHEGEK